MTLEKNKISKDERLERINQLLLQYTLGEYKHRETISDKGDEIDAIVIGLNTLGEELEASGTVVRDYKERMDDIMNILLKYTLSDFSVKLKVSGIGDELDAIIVGLNTMAEELESSQRIQEEQLRRIAATNSFLDAILENIPNMVFVKEAKELRFVRFNKAGEDLLGYSRKDLIGKNDHDIFPKEQAEFFITKDREALNNNSVTDIPEEPIETRNGKKWLHTRKVPVKGPDGEVSYLLGMSEDISERKKFETELKEKKDQLDIIISNAPNGVVVINEKGTILKWNLKSEAIFGWSAEEAVGREMNTLLIPPQYIEAHNKGMRRFLSTGERRVINKVIEITALRKGGVEFPIELGISAVESEGKYLFIAFINDITERKRTEMALKQSEENLRLLIEGARDYAIFLIDPNGNIVNWNKGAELVNLYSAEEAIGKNISIFYTEEDKNTGRPEHSLREAVRLGSYEDEGWRLKNDGTLFWADVIFTPIYDELQQLKGFSKITRDVTAKKTAEEEIIILNKKLEKNVKQLEVVNNELEAFTYSVSHDLRAPLRAIHGYTKILEEELAGKIDEDNKQMMDGVMHNAKKMGQLIDDLLALSRLGKKELIKKETDLTGLMNQSLNELKKIVDTSNAKITIDALGSAIIDPSLLQQVFYNLLSNAVKYSSQEEKPEIQVGLKKENGENVYFIKDNGVGFDMQYYKKLFGVFQRLHDASEFEGTGVGLALVKRIILRHNGKIWAEAEVGKGATFYFTLNN